MQTPRSQGQNGQGGHAQRLFKKEALIYFQANASEHTSDEAWATERKKKLAKEKRVALIAWRGGDETSFCFVIEK